MEKKERMEKMEAIIEKMYAYEMLNNRTYMGIPDKTAKYEKFITLKYVIIEPTGICRADVSANNLEVNHRISSILEAKETAKINRDYIVAQYKIIEKPNKRSIDEIATYKQLNFGRKI